MVKPRVEILGVYRVPLSEELFEKAMKLKYDEVDISHAAKKAVRAELSGVVLIEAQVLNVDDKFDAGDFSQNDQVAYEEVYLSEDGETVISKMFDRPQGDAFRIAFFLHFLDSELSLNTSYGPVNVPAPEEMPERLKRLNPYEPVD